MAKPKKTKTQEVPENISGIAALQARNAELEAELAEARKKRPSKGPDGVKYTKPAPEGEPGSDGQGNFIKYVKIDAVAEQLKSEGWKAA